MNLKLLRTTANRRSTPPVDRSSPSRPEARDHGRTRWPHGAVRYQFTLAEDLATDTRHDFPELAEGDPVTGQRGTVLIGPVTDRAHLYGLLHRFNVQGLTMVEARMLPD